MDLAARALRTIVCATTLLFSVGNAAADETRATTPAPPPAASSGEVSPALIGLPPGAEAPQPPPSHRKLWIALGVISGVAVVGAIVAVGVTIGTSSHDSNSVFHDWGTLTVTRR